MVVMLCASVVGIDSNHDFSAVNIVSICDASVWGKCRDQPGPDCSANQTAETFFQGSEHGNAVVLHSAVIVSQDLHIAGARHILPPPLSLNPKTIPDLTSDDVLADRLHASMNSSQSQ